MVLDEKEQDVLKRLFEKHPNRPAKILKELETEAGMSWKRDEKAFRLVQQELAAPVAGPELYAVYFGAAGSSLKGGTPYGWQPTGQRCNVPVTGAH